VVVEDWLYGNRGRAQSLFGADEGDLHYKLTVVGGGGKKKNTRSFEEGDAGEPLGGRIPRLGDQTSRADRQDLGGWTLNWV